MRLGLNGLSFRKPTGKQMEDCADEGGRNGFNHILPGGSQEIDTTTCGTRMTRITDGWIEDFDAVKVGEGKQAFTSACKAVKSWKHMSLGWVETNRPPMKLGSRVCIAAKMLCFWQRNPLEIVYVNEGTSHTFNKLVSNGVEVTRSKGQGEYFQFGQTTLEGHALAGEESFAVRWKADNTVWYEVYAFSKAQTLLAVGAYPLRRFFQHKFRRDSARCIAATVQQEGLGGMD